jgi:hypothetical protein
MSQIEAFGWFLAGLFAVGSLLLGADYFLGKMLVAWMVGS